MRKQKLVIVPVILLIASLPILADETPEGFVYTDNGTEITITGYTGSATELTIPSTIVGKPVTIIAPNAFNDLNVLESVIISTSVDEIANHAFYSCSNLNSVTFESEGNDGVSTIQSMAFASSRLNEVSLPKTLKSMATDTFRGCSELTHIHVDTFNPVYSSVDGVVYSNNGKTLYCFPWGRAGSYTIPTGVTKIGSSAFAWVLSITAVSIPSSVTTIESDAFYYCRNLSSVTLNSSGNEGVIEVQSGVFAETSLASIYLPRSMANLTPGAFRNCQALTLIHVDPLNPTYSSIDGVLFSENGQNLHQFPTGREGSYVIPDGVKAIETGAFWSSNKLTEVSLPESLTSIGAYAFVGCSGLHNIEIPWGVQTIENTTFSGCDNLESVTFQIHLDGFIFRGIKTIRWEAFSFCDSLTTISIPRTTTEIDPTAFYCCDNLSEILVTDSNNSFSSRNGVLYDKSITTLLIWPGGKQSPAEYPSSLKTIGPNAFSGLRMQSSIRLPDTIETIKYAAFAHCTTLGSIRIPPSVATIENQAFRGCTALESVFFAGSAAPSSFGSQVFYETDPSFQIFFRAGATGFTTPTWNGYSCSSRANAIPALTTIGNKTVQVGQPITFTIQTSDTDEDTLSYAATGNTP